MANSGSTNARIISVPSIVNDYTDEQLNSGYHSKIEYEQAIEKYGTIYKIVDFNDVTKQEDIRKVAKEWIRLHYFDGVRSFTVKAVDLHMLGFNKDKIQVGDRVNVEFLDLYKEPVIKTLTCISAQIDPLNPGNSSYKIGIPDTSMSLKHRFPKTGGSGGGGGGGGTGGSGNDGSTGTGSVDNKNSTSGASLAKRSEDLYSLILNVEHQATINASDIELYAQRINENADNYYRVSNDVNDIQRSAVIQNAAEIINVVGAFNVKENYYGDWPAWNQTGIAYHVGDRVRYDGKGYICIKDVPAGSNIPLSNTEYWSESTGRKGIELINGAAFEIDDLNGERVTVGKRLDEVGQSIDAIEDDIDAIEDDIQEFEGSALWTQRDNITGVSGEFEVYTDPQTGVKSLIIKSGGGMKIRKNNVEYGIYSEDILTGGIIAEKINSGGASSKINFSQLDSNVTDYTAMGLFDNNTLTGGVLVQKINDGTTSTKILGTKVDIQAEQLVELGVYTSNSLTGGIIAEKINSGGASSKINFSQLDSNVTDYTAMGLFDNNTLTGGVLVQKINDDSTITTISGTKVNITANQVRFGDTSDVEAQFGVQDGIIANKATVSELNAVKTRVETIESKYITANQIDSNFITSRISQSSTIRCGELYAGTVSGNSVVATMLNQVDVNQIVKDVYIEDNGDGTYTLTKAKWNGTLTEYTFNRGGGEPSSYQLNYKSSPYTYHVRVKVGETWYESGNLSATNAYDNGWEDSYDQIELSVSGSDTPETPTYGDYLFVKAMGKATSGASSKTTPTGQSLGITIPADRWNDGGATAKMNKASKTLTWDEAYVITAQYVNADGDTVSTSRSITVTAPADRYGTGWTAAYNKVEMPGAGTSGYIRVKYPSSTTDQQTYQDFDVSADNDYAYIKKGSTTVARKAHSAYTNGVNSVTVPNANVAIYGTPAATATSITVRATASNGNYGQASIGITTQRNNAYNSGGATAKVNQSSQTLGYGGSVTVTAQYVNASGTTVNTSSSCTITAPADNQATGWTNCYNTVGLNKTTQQDLGYSDSVTIYAQAKASASATSKTNVASVKITSPADRYGTGWTAAYNKMSIPGAGTSSSMRVSYPSSTTDQQTYQDFDVSADNDYAYIKKGSTTVARKAHSAYTNGVNSVTVPNANVAIYGTPAATATSITVRATASNGNYGQASIGITTQRNNAYNSGGATAKVNQSSQTLGYGGSVTVTAQYVNASGTTVNTSSSCTITAPADNYSTGYNSGFSDGIVAVRQVYSESNRYVDMVYNGAWTGVNGYYIGDMLDSSYNSGAGYGWSLAYGKCSATMHGASSGGTLDITRPGATWDNSVTTTYTTAGLELWAYRGMTLYYYDQGSQRSVRVPNVIYTGSPYITTA